MNTQKIILGILGLSIVISLGFFAANNKEQENIGEPLVTPTKPIENPPNQNPVMEFGKAITFKLNDKVAFSDSLEMTLKEINDSRCPAGVQCIWAGEISGLFIVSGGSLSVSKEIRLGTVNNKSIFLEGYTFSLEEATKTSITIKVEKK